MILCTRCGHKNPDTSIQCLNCKKKLQSSRNTLINKDEPKGKTFFEQIKELTIQYTNMKTTKYVLFQFLILCSAIILTFANIIWAILSNSPQPLFIGLGILILTLLIFFWKKPNS